MAKSFSRILTPHAGKGQSPCWKKFAATGKHDNKEGMPFRTRRSIKPAQMDASRTLAPELLKEILTDAHWAPCHGLTQPWRFHVFTGDGRLRLAEALQDLYRKLTPASDFKPEKWEKFPVQIGMAPVVIALCVNLESEFPEWEEIAATACAAQNIQLSAHMRGIGSYWSTPEVACHADFLAWLGEPTEGKALGLLYLGYPKTDALPHSVRKPLATRVTYHP